VPAPDGFTTLPALAVQIGDSQRGDGDGADALFRCRAGVARSALDADGHAIAARGPDGDLVGRSVIEVEGQLGPAQHAQRAEAGAVQADFLLYGPEEGERPVLGLLAKHVERGGQDGGRAAAVVAAQARLLVGRDDVAPFLHRLGPTADRHRIDVGHEHPPRSGARAGQFEHEVAGLAAVRDLAMGLVELQHRVSRPGLAELRRDKVHHLPLLAAKAGNGKQLEQKIVGLV